MESKSELELNNASRRGVAPPRRAAAAAAAASSAKALTQFGAMGRAARVCVWEPPGAGRSAGKLAACERRPALIVCSSGARSAAAAASTSTGSARDTWRRRRKSRRPFKMQPPRKDIDSLRAFRVLAAPNASRRVARLHWRRAKPRRDAAESLLSCSRRTSCATHKRILRALSRELGRRQQRKRRRRRRRRMQMDSSRKDDNK